MFSTQPLLVLFLTLAMELGLTACGAEPAAQPGSWTPEPPEAAAAEEATPPVPEESGDAEAEQIDLAPHFAAWTAMLAAAGGLPPAPPRIAPIAPTHYARAPRPEEAGDAR